MTDGRVVIRELELVWVRMAGSVRRLLGPRSGAILTRESCPPA
jgi:hypothetical protein